MCMPVHYYVYVTGMCLWYAVVCIVSYNWHVITPGTFGFADPPRKRCDSITSVPMKTVDTDGPSDPLGFKQDVPLAFQSTMWLLYM